MTIGKGRQAFSPFTAPHSNQQRREYYYIYAEWRTLSETKLVTGLSDQPGGQQVLVNAVNEVIDVHPIEHVFNHRETRPGMMIKMIHTIPRWLFEAVERFNAEELEAMVAAQGAGGNGNGE